MGRLFRFYFEDPDYFMCSSCGTHIASQEDQDSTDESSHHTTNDISFAYPPPEFGNQNTYNIQGRATEGDEAICPAPSKKVRNFPRFASPIEPGVLEGLFITVVNVEVNEQQRPYARHGNHSVSDIYCVKCGDKLGFKYILTFMDGRIIKNELVQLRMNKLLLSEEDLKRKKTYGTLRIGG